VISGGLVCVAGAMVVAVALPGFTKMRSVLRENEDDALARAEDDVAAPAE
jgi:hypothetical protein